MENSSADGKSAEAMKIPRVGVAVFIFNKDGCVLLGKRKSSVGHSTYALPGGHLEFGESWEDCAAREVKEETGLTISNIRLATVTNNIMLEEAKPCHYVIILMRSELSNEEETPRLMEPDKCEGWHWFPWDHLPSPLFSPLASLLDSGYSPF